MISIIKSFNKLLTKKQKNKIAILFVMMLIGVVLEILGVSLMLPLVTAFMQPDFLETNLVAGKIAEVFSITDTKTFLLACIVVLIIMFVAKDSFLILEYYTQARFVSNNRFLTQSRLLDCIINRPYEYFLTASTGEIIQIVQEDTRSVFGLLSTLLLLFTESIISVAIIITIFIIDPMITLFVAGVVMITVIVVIRFIRPVMRKEGQIQIKHNAMLNKWLLQSVVGIKEIKINCKEEFFKKNFEENGKKVVGAERKYSVFTHTPRVLIEMVTVCSVLAVVGIMVAYGRPVESIITSMGAFVMAAVKLMPSANRIVNSYNTLLYAKPALEKMIENMSLIEDSNASLFSEESLKDTDGTKGISLKKDVTFRNITYAYPNSDTNVLTEANMTIPIGKSVGIVGMSGAGKTTAVDIMLGLLSPQGGQVLADGVDVMSDYACWLSCIGYVPQSIFMMDDTIRANVAFGIQKKDIDDDKVWEVLSEAKLDDYVRGLPEGLDTTIGERGIRLSGGQRQRIGIARALYSDPEILVFDEATSSLDNETEQAIMESINSLHGKKTLVIIAHRLQTIEKCDIVYRVRDGKIELV